MKKLPKVLAVLLAATMMFALFGCETVKAMLKIGIIQYVEHAALDAAREGFVKALKDNGYVDGQNIEIDVQNAQADQANLKSIAQRFVNDKEDLILAIATPAAQAMASETKDIPILGTAITDYEGAKLIDKNEAPGGNVSGTTDMNPVKEQVDLIKKLVPGVKTVGLLYTSSEDNSVLQAGLVKDACKDLGLAVKEATVTSSNDVQQVTQSLVGKVDAIYIPTDNVCASAMPVISQITTDAKIPVICGEANMVLGGGLATMGIDYSKLGYQTGEMAVKILKGEAETATMPIESQTEFAYTINGDIAKAIGLTVPQDLKDAVVYPSQATATPTE